MKKILLIFSLVFFFSSVYALGCCFDAGTGTCSPQSEQSTCTGEGANFFSDPTCASSSECDYGCCTLGTAASYTREVTCYQQAQAAGLTYAWAAGSEASCSASANSANTGACVISGRYDKTCTYTSGANCNNGQFYPGLYCSNPALNTSCVKTLNTTCYQDNVNYLDSCGNIDEKKQTCDYAAGSICEKNSSTKAFCKDLNCGDYEKKNGERWCVESSGKGNVFDMEGEESVATGEAIFSQFTGEAIKNGVRGTISESGLFLRNKENAKTITGNAITEMHTPEECAAQEAAQLNPSQQENILNRLNYEKCKANVRNFTTTKIENAVYDPYTCEKCDQSWDVCGDNLCERCKNDLGGESWPGRLEGCVKDNACGSGGGEASVGSRFFSQYCLNGEVYNEPCEDYRMSFCSEESGGKCEVNEGASCYGAAKADCNEDACIWYDPAGGSIKEIREEVRNGQSISEAIGELNPLLADLGLGLCVPKIAPGTELAGQNGTGAQIEQDVCALANFNATIKLDYCETNCNPGSGHYPPRFMVIVGQRSHTDPITSQIQLDYGNAGLIYSDMSGWIEQDRDIDGFSALACNPIYPLFNPEQFGFGPRELVRSIPVDPAIEPILQERCQALGDCTGKTNWIGALGSKNNSVAKEIRCLRQDETWYCKFEYKCSAWKAPTGSESCEMCGSDGLPCSEYRCASLGKACEYFEPAGADKGYCLSSADNTPPTISASLNPPSPIPPYTSVEVTITTNEDSQCAFNMGSAGSSFTDMEYSIDDGWGKEHKVILNVPGRRTSLDNNDTTSYDLINNDGVYNMYVRCEDPAGNFNLAAKLVRFEVMDTPDKVPPVITNITPVSGSAIMFNTTQKAISLKVNEPAECRWSSQDKEYSLMENQFTCDSVASNSGVLNGYFCSGVITNVTQNMSLQTRYFIRCKDQPYLEGHEDQYYTRNANPTSKEYVLRPSSELKVNSILPTGTLIVGAGVSNLTLSAKTEGGAENGKAKCNWRLVYENITTMYVPFSVTNATMHTQVITNKSEANYQIQVRCQDIAGNIVEGNSSLSLRIDRSSPIISRIFNDKGSLKIATNEPASCKFVFANPSINNAISCLFAFASTNATAMIGPSNVQHTTPWKKGFTYLIRCQDFFGNTNSGCGIEARAEK